MKPSAHWELKAGDLKLLFRIAIPVPAPRGTGRIEHLKPVASGQLSVASTRVLGTPHYRFENWNRFRAPFWPYFFRSLPRESRVTMPSDFSLPRSSALNCIRARAIPSLTASA